MLSMVTELTKDLFIPDAPMAELVPYRCIPRTMVVHINKEFRVSNRMIAFRFFGGESQRKEKLQVSKMSGLIHCDWARDGRSPDLFKPPICGSRKRTGGFFCPPVVG
jgi:hypothetical protein